MVCKGICVRHKAYKPVGSGRYAIGQKRCQICDMFLKWDGIFCPCCGCRLRIGPRLFKHKAKLRMNQKENQILVDKLIGNDQIKSKLVQTNFHFSSK
jgi:hypothetical protein